MLAVAACITARLPVSVCIIRGSRLTVAACINGETVIFDICCIEALCSLSLHVSQSVAIGKTAILGTYHKEASCINGGTLVFSIYYQKVLCSPLLHA